MLRECLDDLAQEFVVAHAASTVYPELDRRAAKLETAAAERKRGTSSRQQQDVGLSAKLAERAKDEVERMLRQGTHFEIVTVYDNSRHALMIPPLEAEHEAGSTDLVFGHCGACHTELRAYKETHPCYAQLGRQSLTWRCNVCGDEFTPTETLFCCPTFNACQWQACASCQSTC
eukprot:COSAG01_NODE_2699_length_7235_cov_5.600196_4_plen_174_part_00